jgi:hypothetical protein
MIHQITAMQWDAFDQPEWNTCNSIVDALTGLITATDAQSSSAAYHHVLYAVGNNHAGTYYPVLIAVLPFLEKIAIEGTDWPQRTALSILDDLFASFSPEPDHEWIVVPHLGLQPTEAVFKQRLHMMRGALEHIVNHQNPSAQIAQALLDLLNDDMT